MSIRGNPYRWLQGALSRGDLSGVRAAAAELERRVNLADSLSIVLLMAARRDASFGGPRTGVAPLAQPVDARRVGRRS